MIRIPGKIPLTIYPMFFAMIAFLGWIHSGAFQPTLVWMAVIFVSVLVHEFGHAFTAVAFGQNASIALVAMGGLTTRRGPRLALWKEFLVVANGPLFGILLFVVSSYIKGLVPEAPAPLLLALNVSIFVNLFWSLLNLLPIGPLDGAKLLSIFLEGSLGAKGLRLSFLISLTCGTLLAMGAFAIGQPLLGAILFLLTFESFRLYQAHRSMTEEDRDGQLQQVFQEGQLALEEGHKELAIQKFEEIRRQTNSGLLHLAVRERLAHLYSEQGEFEEAYNLLAPVADQVEAGSVRLVHRLAYYMRDSKLVNKVGDRCFDLDGSAETAFINAVTHAMEGEVEPSVGWLQRAHQEGMEQLEEALEKKEFDPIRQDPLFEQFKNTL